MSHRVWDDDGDFVLIEAAYNLPRWLNPDRAHNRVWWHAGRLHIVPPPSPAHPTLPHAPTIQQALATVRGEAIDTTVDDSITATLDRRMAGTLDQSTNCQTTTNDHHHPSHATMQGCQSRRVACSTTPHTHSYQCA